MSKRTYNSVYYVLDKNVHTCTRPCMCGVDTVLQLLAGIRVMEPLPFLCRSGESIEARRAGNTFAHHASHSPYRLSEKLAMEQVCE